MLAPRSGKYWICHCKPKVMFLHLSVILFTGGCLPQCMLGYTPHGQTPPLGRHPPWADTLHGQTPPRQTPPSRRLLLRTVRIQLECILVIQIEFPVKVDRREVFLSASLSHWMTKLQVFVNGHLCTMYKGRVMTGVSDTWHFKDC